MNMTCNLREFKEFIDNEMIVILGQMDSPTEIFEHVFLVKTALLACRTPQRNTVVAESTSSIVLFSLELVLFVRQLKPND